MSTSTTARPEAADATNERELILETAALSLWDASLVRSEWLGRDVAAHLLDEGWQPPTGLTAAPATASPTDLTAAETALLFSSLRVHQWANWSCSCGNVDPDLLISEDEHLAKVLPATVNQILAARVTAPALENGHRP